MSQAQAPLNLGDFVDPKGWLDELNLDQPKQHGESAALKAIPSNITAGNLSALEEDDLAGKKIPMPSADASASGPAAPLMLARPPTPAHPISGAMPLTAGAAQLTHPVEKRGNGAMIGILIGVLVVAGLGLAYALHLFG